MNNDFKTSLPVLQLNDKYDQIIEMMSNAKISFEEVHLVFDKIIDQNIDYGQLKAENSD